jgi:hypothetical protein
MTAAALVAGCSNDADEVENGYVPSNNAIAFDANTDDGLTTRASGQINSDDDLQGTSFGVFGSYTGALRYENTTVSPDFMYNQEVKYSGGSWSYRPVKYWPNDSREYVSFFAYAPFVEDPQANTEGIIDMSKLSDLGDPWVNYRIAADPWSTTSPQVDLLYGQQELTVGGNTTYIPWLDQQKPTDPVNGKMKFTFRHALACIGDEITIKCSDALKTLIQDYATINITQIKIDYKDLTTKGRLVLKSEDEANWKEIISGEITTTRTYTKDVDITFPTVTTATISEGDGLFYIPLRVAGMERASAEVTITYTVNNGVSSYSGTSSTSFELDMNLEGKKQGIALQLTETLDLQHLVYVIGDGATEPSYSPKR